MTPRVILAVILTAGVAGVTGYRVGAIDALAARETPVVYEDGSYRFPSGATGCLTGAPCSRGVTP